MTEDQVVEEFPYLEKDDIFASLVYGLDGEDIPPKIRSLQFDLLMKKTPNERVAMDVRCFIQNVK